MQEPNWLRGIRGATTVEADDANEILAATRELLEEMLAANGITDFEVIASIFFTTTPDLHATFPAEGARAIGMTMVPLLCFQEIPVAGRLERCIRIMMQVNTSKRQSEMRHIYLRKAVTLRPDLASAQ